MNRSNTGIQINPLVGDVHEILSRLAVKDLKELVAARLCGWRRDKMCGKTSLRLAPVL